MPGGSFDRSNDAAYPATVSPFRLDGYEVTIGRYRKFVAASSQTMIAASVPILYLTGDADTELKPAPASCFFGRLAENGAAPVECVYPGEAHEQPRAQLDGFRPLFPSGALCRAPMVRSCAMRAHLSIFRAGVMLALGFSALACSGETDESGALRPCQGSTPEAHDPALSRCSDGTVHRTTAAQCTSSLPRPDPCVSAAGTSGCTTDSDCGSQAHGYCQQSWESPTCSCSYGCVKDSDCEDGYACACSQPVGYCLQATCLTDADCAGGALCVRTRLQKCGGMGFACQQAGDQCNTDEHCTDGQQCALAGGVRKCLQNDCPVPGRPFLVDDAPRVAALAERSDWLDELSPCCDGMSTELRARLAAHWARVGQMEHASVAAFARFTLQLLSLGAPANLLGESQVAAADEIRHARLCFGLSSAYAGSASGPAPLEVAGALGEDDVATIVRLTFREGCVGESAAAHEARVSGEAADDETIERVLTGIAADEERHALTAWKFMRWAVTELGSAARDALRDEIARLESESSPTSFARGELSRHGVFDDEARLALRAEVVREVVLPCARALLAPDAGRLPARAA